MRRALQALGGGLWLLGSRFGTLLASLGRSGVRKFDGAAYLMAVVWASLSLAARPSSWTRAVRDVFMRQMLFTAVDGVGISSRIAISVGVLLIVQAVMWLDTVGGTSDLLAPFMLKTVVRELGPLIAGLVVIGRSGVTVATELANMRTAGEVDVLEAQGIDPMTYLVMPRVICLAVSMLCLGVVVVASIFVSGYVVGALTGSIRTGPQDFFDAIFAASTLEDLVFFVPKTVVAGLLAGAICAVEGLRVRGAITDVPLVASRSGVKALAAVFLVSAVMSLIIYGRVLIFQIA